MSERAFIDTNILIYAFEKSKSQKKLKAVELMKNVDIHFSTSIQVLNEFWLNKRISVSKGAELAEMTIYDFLKECKENDIPVIDYSKEELKGEFENIKKELLC